MGIVGVIVAPLSAAEAPGDLAYARLYTAKVASGEATSAAALEQIARTKGCIEVIVFYADGDPTAPVRRTITSLGEAAYSYPGFSVGARQMLAEQKAADVLAISGEGKAASAPFETRGVSGVMEWSLPEADDAPLGVVARSGGKVLARSTVYPVAGKGSDRPRMIETVAPDKDITIAQVFEYLDAAPTIVEAASVASKTAAAAVAEKSPAAKEASTATDDVSFDAELTGVSWSWDTKWWPGENEEPGGYPLQIRILMGAGADVSSHVEGDFALDYDAAALQVGAGSGDLVIDLGAELSAQGSVDIGIIDPFVFDIPYVPQFDLRVYDEVTFNSFLLDSSVSIEDATGRQNVVSVDILELIAGGLIEDIPGLGGGISIDADLGVSGEMTAESISVSDGNVFTGEGESRPATVGLTGYQASATYNEDLEMTVTLTAYPVFYLEFLWMSWDLPVFDLPWDIVTGPLDLDFSTSALDFPPRMYPLTLDVKNASWGEVQFDPEPADPNAPEFAAGSEVTLTAVPAEGRGFKEWEIYDPNSPDDANYAVIDTNLATTILITGDQHVVARFKCGSGIESGLPLLMLTAAMMAAASYRRRRR